MFRGRKVTIVPVRQISLEVLKGKALDLCVTSQLKVHIWGRTEESLRKAEK